MGAGTQSGAVAAFDEVYLRSDLFVRNSRELDRVSVPSLQRPMDQPGFDRSYASSYSTQLRAVTARLFCHYWRDLSYYGVKMQVMLVLGLILGLVYRGISTDSESGLLSAIALLNLCCGFVGLIHCFAALPVIMRLRDVFYRERSSQTYAGWTHAMGLGIVEIPFVFASMLCFALPVYWLVGFTASASLFFRFLLVVSLMALLFAYVGVVLASALPNISLAAMVQGAIVSFGFLFAGVYIRRPNMPAYWSWLYYINPIPKGFVALAIQQFDCTDAPDGTQHCPRVSSVQYGDGTKWHFVEQYLASGGGEWQARYIGWIVCSIGIIFLAALLVISKISHVKR